MREEPFLLMTQLTALDMTVTSDIIHWVPPLFKVALIGLAYPMHSKPLR